MHSSFHINYLSIYTYVYVCISSRTVLQKIMVESQSLADFVSLSIRIRVTAISINYTNARESVCVFVKGEGRCPWIEKIPWARFCHESLPYEMVPPSKAPGISRLILGTIHRCQQLCKAGGWSYVGIQEHNHIYATQEGLEIAPAFGGTQNKNKNRRKKKKKVFTHLSWRWSHLTFWVLSGFKIL